MTQKWSCHVDSYEQAASPHSRATPDGHKLKTMDTFAHPQPVTRRQPPPPQVLHPEQECGLGSGVRGLRPTAQPPGSTSGLPTWPPQAVCLPHAACLPKPHPQPQGRQCCGGSGSPPPKGSCPRLPVSPVFSLRPLTFPKLFKILARYYCNTSVGTRDHDSYCEARKCPFGVSQFTRTPSHTHTHTHALSHSHSHAVSLFTHSHCHPFTFTGTHCLTLVFTVTHLLTRSYSHTVSHIYTHTSTHALTLKFTFTYTVSCTFILTTHCHT